MAGAAYSLEAPRTRDLVVVVPGIMGSELVDERGRLLWGFADPRWYIRAWTSERPLEALRLTDEELAGTYRRVQARRLLRFPAFMPFLAGLEPYAALVEAVKAMVPDVDAVRTFPYDWRLPVAHNGQLLAKAAMRWLTDWRGSPAEIAFRRIDPTGDDAARLVLVAHSMGGLLVREACRDAGFASEVRASITLGTPFYGAPKAVLMISDGAGVPLPRKRVRQLARALPGVYDLLPQYRCVEGTNGEGRRLTIDDVTAVGGDGDLARSSLSWHASIKNIGVPNHTQVAGLYQPTTQSISIHQGQAQGSQWLLADSKSGTQRHASTGDATVPRVSAALPGAPVTPLGQTHSGVANSSDALLVVQDVLVNQRIAPWLGSGELGIEVPDVITAGRNWTFGITGAERSTDFRCTVSAVLSGRTVDVPVVDGSGGTADVVILRGRPLPEGLYRVEVNGGGASPIQQMVMAAASKSKSSL